MNNLKKVLLLFVTLLLMTGCKKDESEKEDMFYDSLTKAYTIVFSTKGVGLSVFADQTVNVEGTTWYMVATNNYKDVKVLHTMNKEVYTKKLKNKYDKIIDEKYMNVDDKLYTTSNGGCKLPYLLTDDLTKELKEDVKITKVKGKKITFKYNKREYEAKLVKDNYVFDNELFKCEN